MLEKQIQSLIRSLRSRPLSVFTLPQQYKKGLGYWFQAKNLSWKLEDEQLVCTGGIVLNKGDITAHADTLSGDVEFKKVMLEGSPRVVITPDGAAPVTFEAQSFLIESQQDLFTAQGNPVATWDDAILLSDTARYYQADKKLALQGNVRVNYRDISAWGDSADYFTDRQNIVFSGNARANQGENKLSSQQVNVSLKDRKISLLGKSKVIVNSEEIK
jgi:lipopolysaccharide export system protein LptA